MSNVFDDEKKKNKKDEEDKQDASEKETVKAEKQKEKDLKEAEKAKLKAEARAELEAEAAANAELLAKKRDEKINSIRNKKTKSTEDREILKRLLVERAKENSKKPRNLDTLQPSQLSLEEMIDYCDINGIEYKKGDSTILLRARIKAFRNPGREERLRMLENANNLGRTVR